CPSDVAGRPPRGGRGVSLEPPCQDVPDTARFLQRNMRAMRCAARLPGPIVSAPGEPAGEAAEPIPSPVGPQTDAPGVLRAVALLPQVVRDQLLRLLAERARQRLVRVEGAWAGVVAPAVPSSPVGPGRAAGVRVVAVVPVRPSARLARVAAIRIRVVAPAVQPRLLRSAAPWARRGTPGEGAVVVSCVAWHRLLLRRSGGAQPATCRPVRRVRRRPASRLLRDRRWR